MDKVDYEVTLAKCLQIAEQTLGGRLDNWLIKKFGKTKINNIAEYMALRAFSSSYYILYMHTEIETCEKVASAKNILEMLNETFSLTLDLLFIQRKGIVKEWYAECLKLRTELVNDLLYFISHPTEIDYYTNAKIKMKNYCEKNQTTYEEWETELAKYDVGKKKRLVGLILAFGIALSALGISKYHEFRKSNFIESQEEYEGVSLEDIDVEMILARKL